MEDDAKGEPTQCKEPKFLAKAGWVKKAPGRLLASYKDRYIHVEKTEVVVYENENLQNCLERFDLENYDKCHELKSPFKKKHRLILIRSPKPGNKVQDVKFQAQTAEEKEAWIKALSDAINRAKNKIFDEVTVESSNLEHVTRTRPKGNRNRRPPTRIHMKEVADVSSDGVLRLDLDLENALMPNGTHQASVDGSETPRAKSQGQTPSSSNANQVSENQSGPKTEEEGAQTEASPQKKVIKPPMPPIKEAKPSTSEDEPEKDDSQVKKVLKPPMPPSKEAKPCAPTTEEATEKENPEKVSEESPAAKNKTTPPTPPNKPTSSSSTIAEASQSTPNPQAPAPPSKDKKPSQQAVEPHQEVQASTDDSEAKEDSEKDVEEAANEAKQMNHKERPPSDGDVEPEGPSAAGQAKEAGETESGDKSTNNEPQVPTESVRKSLSPPRTPKKEKPAQPEDTITSVHPTELQDPTASLQTASNTSASCPQAEEPQPKSETLAVVVSLNDPITDGLNLSPLLGPLHGEKKKKAEEKSVDSGQHSDDDSEGSGSEDTLALSTAALRGSHAGLDVLDASEDDVQIPGKSQVKSKPFPCKPSQPIPLKPSTKARSASFGDLLSDSSASARVTQNGKDVPGNNGAANSDVMKLEAEVALEMENTRRLLSEVSQSQEGGDGESMPEDLLAKAMEKLKKADNVLREVQKLSSPNNSNKRKSW